VHEFYLKTSECHEINLIASISADTVFAGSHLAVGITPWRAEAGVGGANGTDDDSQSTAVVSKSQNGDDLYGLEGPRAARETSPVRHPQPR
jgi:hypothetical protein